MFEQVVKKNDEKKTLIFFSVEVILLSEEDASDQVKRSKRKFPKFDCAPTAPRVNSASVIQSMNDPASIQLYQMVANVLQNQPVPPSIYQPTQNLSPTEYYTPTPQSQQVFVPVSNVMQPRPINLTTNNRNRPPLQPIHNVQVENISTGNEEKIEGLFEKPVNLMSYFTKTLKGRLILNALNTCSRQVLSDL